MNNRRRRNVQSHARTPNRLPGVFTHFPRTGRLAILDDFMAIESNNSEVVTKLHARNMTHSRVAGQRSVLHGRRPCYRAKAACYMAVVVPEKEVRGESYLWLLVSS